MKVFKRYCLDLFYRLAYYSGIITLFYKFNRKQRIIVYHNVISDEFWDDSPHLCASIKTSVFKKQLAIINKRFRVVCELGKVNTAVITFDDGYSNMGDAAEILSLYGNKAYIFIPVNNVGSSFPLWIDAILWWISYVPKGAYHIHGQVYQLSDMPSRNLARKSICDRIVKDYKLKQTIVEYLDKIYPFNQIELDSEYFRLRFQGLTNEQISVLKAEGFKIGAHSADHDILSELNQTELDEDFQKTSIESGRLYNTSLFAYPFGHQKDVTKAVMDACSQYGFRQAVMNEYVRQETNYTLSRISLSDSISRFEVEARLSGFKQYLKNIFH